jgi:hypothetical protein
MNTTIIVEFFFVVSVIVFASTLYIIAPISLLKKKVVFKENSILDKKITVLKKR